ncbi:uncharacterized protein LOC129869705 [Solanum dulcamara]|uniref:uncharacterized protein LOC129869705 n=1 Tax=Solanum dulcamara TaxID=45834 RepID=UPI0024866FCB|nr:uncharacterized protein LOC129869705 [Solanum dulcamara]
MDLLSKLLLSGGAEKVNAVGGAISIEASIKERFTVETLAAFIMIFEGDFLEEFDENVNALQGLGSYPYAPEKLDLDLKNRPTPLAKLSMEEPHVVELKELPCHLSNMMPEDLTVQQRKKFLHDVNIYLWDDPYLFRMFVENVHQKLSILEAYHSSPVIGHHSGARIAQKLLQCKYYWATIYRNAYDLEKSCNKCQRHDAISRLQEFPLTPMLEVELFDVWGIDFMGSFMSSYGMKYILVAVDYISK